MPTYEQLEAEIDEATRLGDLDKLDELLAQVSGTGDKAEASPPSDDPETEQDVQQAEKEAKPAEEEARRDVLRAKDGVNEIPFSVLEAAREAEADAKRQVAELQAQLNEARQAGQQTGTMSRDLEDLQALNLLLTEQIKEAGLSPKTTPDKFVLSDEVARELKDEYGVVGRTIADIADAVVALRGRLGSEAKALESARAPADQPKQPSSSVQQIVESDPDLSRWLKDPLAWAVAQKVDQELAESAGYVGKSFSDRRAEVVAVTRQRLGEQPARTKTVDDIPVRERIPASLSDVGGESRDVARSPADEIKGMSDAQALAKVDALYARGGQKAVDAFLDSLH